MSFFIKKGIKTELITSIVLLTVFAVTTIGYLGLKTSEDASVYRKTKEAESVAKLLKYIVANQDLGYSVLSGDTDLFDSDIELTTDVAETITTEDAISSSEISPLADIENIFSEVGIYDVVLRDDNGGVLISRGKILGFENGDSEVLIDNNGIVISRIGERNFLSYLFSGPGTHLYVSVKEDDSNLERLSFTVSLADISVDLRNLRNLFLVLAIVDALIIIAIGVMRINVSIMRPLKKLESAAFRISSGSLSDRAVVVVKNELGNLASAFNSMAERLEGEIKRLERVNKELVSTQDELLQSNILASMGRLAAGVAHEIGNPLGAVSGYLDILSKGIKDKAEERDILKRAGTELDRINTIVRDFLEISRPSVMPNLELLDINNIVEEVAQTMGYDSLFKGIEINFVLVEGLPEVYCDDGKIRQVVINFLKNSAQAMEGRADDEENAHGNTITISTGLETIFEEKIGAVKRRRGDMYLESDHLEDPYHRTYVYIAVHDEGSGIDEEHIKNIFEPFYTTKSSGKGTGLGLFMAQTIVKAYGGKIECKSEIGTGTEFKVYLPLGDKRDEDSEDRRAS